MKRLKDYRKMPPRYVLIHITADESFLRKQKNNKTLATEYIGSLIKGVCKSLIIIFNRKIFYFLKPTRVSYGTSKTLNCEFKSIFFKLILHPKEPCYSTTDNKKCRAEY